MLLFFSTGLPAEPRRRLGPTGGLFPEISTPTARRRFPKKGWKGSQSIEEVAAVKNLYLTLRSGLRLRRNRVVKVRGRAARERLGDTEPWYVRRVAQDESYTSIYWLLVVRVGWRKRRLSPEDLILVVDFCLAFFFADSGYRETPTPLFFDSPDPVCLPGPGSSKGAKEELLRGFLCLVPLRRHERKESDVRHRKEASVSRAIAPLGTLVRQQGDLRCFRRLAQIDRLARADAAASFPNISGAADLEISYLGHHFADFRHITW